MRPARLTVPAALMALTLQATAAGFREQQSWQFRSPSETRVKLNIEVRRLELRSRAGNGGTTVVTLGGGAALASGSATGTTTQSGASALNRIDATPGLTIEGSNNVVTIDGFLNLTVDQQADRARSRILNR